MSVEYGRYQDLAESQHSRINKFIPTKDPNAQQEATRKKALSKLKKGVHRAISFNRVLEKLTHNVSDDNETVRSQSIRTGYRSLDRVGHGAIRRKLAAQGTEKVGHSTTFKEFLWMFLSAASWKEAILVCIPDSI